VRLAELRNKGVRSAPATGTRRNSPAPDTEKRILAPGFSAAGDPESPPSRKMPAAFQQLDKQVGDREVRARQLGSPVYSDSESRANTKCKKILAYSWH
jgi:hypothetical protein